MRVELHCAVCGKPFIGKFPEEVWRLMQELRPNTKHVCGDCEPEDLFKMLAEKKP